MGIKPHDWDLKDLLTRREYLPKAVKDPHQYRILETILDQFETNVVPLINVSVSIYVYVCICIIISIYLFVYNYVSVSVFPKSTLEE